MNTSEEHILQCNQSEPIADASGRIVDMMNENGMIASSILFAPIRRGSFDIRSIVFDAAPTLKQNLVIVPCLF